MQLSVLKSYGMRSALLIVSFWVFWRLASLFEVSPHVSAFYPAPALTVAFMAVFGWRYIPIAFVAAILSPFPGHVLENGLFDVFQGIRQAVLYGLAGELLRRLPGQSIPLRTTKDAASFIMVGVLATLASASAAYLLFMVYDTFPRDVLAEVFFSFWAGDASGVLMVTPLLLVVLARTRGTGIDYIDLLHAHPKTRAVIQIFLLPVVVGILGFSLAARYEWLQHITYILMLPVVWGAAQHGLIGGVASAAFANISAVLAYQATGAGNFPAVEIQVLFAATACLGMVVGSAFDDKKAVYTSMMNQERELSRIARISMIGELGTTIIHEINSPLQTIALRTGVCFSELRKSDLDREKIAESVGEIDQAITRISDIQKSVRQFTQKGKDTFEEVDLNIAVRSSIDLLSSEVEQSKTTVDLVLSEGLPPIKSTMPEIQQVVINLAKNGLDAMAHLPKQRRILSIATEQDTPDKVELIIADQGEGVPSEIRQELFETFRTTKVNGTGIGLAVCRTIVESAGGSIWLSEEVDVGAEFHVSLPVAKGEQDG